jgi:hypothetical protein
MIRPGTVRPGTVRPSRAPRLVAAVVDDADGAVARQLLGVRGVLELLDVQARLCAWLAQHLQQLGRGGLAQLAIPAPHHLRHLGLPQPCRLVLHPAHRLPERDHAVRAPEAQRGVARAQRGVVRAVVLHRHQHVCGRARRECLHRCRHVRQPLARWPPQPLARCERTRRPPLEPGGGEWISVYASGGATSACWPAILARRRLGLAIGGPAPAGKSWGAKARRGGARWELAGLLVAPVALPLARAPGVRSKTLSLGVKAPLSPPGTKLPSTGGAAGRQVPHSCRKGSQPAKTPVQIACRARSERCQLRL